MKYVHIMCAYTCVYVHMHMSYLIDVQCPSVWNSNPRTPGRQASPVDPFGKLILLPFQAGEKIKNLKSTFKNTYL